MKRLVFLLLAIAGSLLARSQTVSATRYDTTIFAPPAGRPGNELIIQNATKARIGAFLQNYSQGRTRFAYAVDSVWVASGSLYARRGDTTLVYALPSGTGAGLTPEEIQDIIGSILGPEFSYNDAANLITIGSVDWGKIANKPPVISFETDPTVPPWVKAITQANIAYWNGKQDALGFTPENVANKSPFSALGLSNTLYPTQRAVKIYVDSIFNTVSATGGDSVFHYVYPLYDSSGFIKIAGYNASQWNAVYNWYQSNPLAPYATILQLNGKQDKLGYTPVPDTFSLTINGQTLQLKGSGQTFTIPGGSGTADSIYFMPRWFYVMAGEGGAMDSVFMDETVDSLIFGSIGKAEAYNTFLKISDYNPQNIFNADLQQGASHTHDANGHSLNFSNGDSLQLGYNHIFLQAPATSLPTDSAYYRDEAGALQYGPINAPPQVSADWLADEGPPQILHKPTKLSDFENDLPASITSASINWPLGMYNSPTTGTVAGGAITFSPVAANQAANTFLGGPLTGTGPPAFRQLGTHDISSTLNLIPFGGIDGKLAVSDSFYYNRATQQLVINGNNNGTVGAGAFNYGSGNNAIATFNTQFYNAGTSSYAGYAATNNIGSSGTFRTYSTAFTDPRFANRTLLISSTGLSFFSYGVIGTNVPTYANYRWYLGITSAPTKPMMQLNTNGHLLVGDTVEVDSGNPLPILQVHKIIADSIVYGAGTLGGGSGSSYTDANARAAISLTTTGTSGAATYNSSTGVLNIPQYTGGGSSSNAIQEVTTGTSATIAVSSDLLINHASTVASFTATLPASPASGQEVAIIAGQAVTSFTVSPNTSQTIVQASTPTTLQAGEAIVYKFYNTKWYRKL